MPPRPPRALWKRRLLLLAGSTVLALVLGELALRLVGFRIDPPLHVGERESPVGGDFVVDPVTGWRMRPDHAFHWAAPDGRQITYAADANGFRTDPTRTPRSAPMRLAVVGDSFSWGSDVAFQDTYGARLARALDADVHNYAMPGFGLDQIWLSLRSYALPAEPDLIVVGIFHEDFERSRTAFRARERASKPRFELKRGRLVAQTAADAPVGLERFLERNLRLWMLGRAALRHAGRWVPIGEWWWLNEALLDQMRADCAAADVPVLFLNIPDARWRSFPVLRDYMARSGANYVDPVELSPAPPPDLFHVGAEKGPLGHLNAEGHRYLSELLRDWIEAHPTRAR